jgi:hypothetical protein
MVMIKKKLKLFLKSILGPRLNAKDLTGAAGADLAGAALVAGPH